MAIWEWVRELPIIDDVADAVEIFGELLPESGAGDVPVGAYDQLRESMYWTTGEDGFDTRQHLLINSSLEPVSFGQNGQVASGLWRDPLSGFESKDPLGGVGRLFATRWTTTEEMWSIRATGSLTWS